MGLKELRESTSDGTLPAYAWPGGYQMVYYTEGGLTICPKCANDPDTSDPVKDGEVYWEGPDLICEDKGEAIPSAYGDPGLLELVDAARARHEKQIASGHG